jgi:1,4-dihydroxy-2-naphthoate octaprenyltransferase
MDDFRGDELRSVAADLSLGRGAEGYPARVTPSLAGAALTAKPVPWIARLRPGALLFGLTPALATLLYIWGETGSLNLLFALCALVGVAGALAGANLLDVYLDTRRRAWALDESWDAQRTLIASLTLLLIAGLAGIPLALDGGWPVFALGLGGLALATLYTAAPGALRLSPLGDLALFVALGPGVIFLAALSQRQTLMRPLWLLGLALGAFALAIPYARHLRDRNADVEHGRRTVATLLGQTGGQLALVASFAFGYTLLAAFALPFGAPHLALLAFLALPAVAIAITGAYRASEIHSRRLAVRAAIHAYTLIVVWLLAGLLVNSLYLRISSALASGLLR